MNEIVIAGSSLGARHNPDPVSERRRGIARD